MNACAFRLPSLSRSRSSSRQTVSKSYSTDFSASNLGSPEMNPLSPTVYRRSQELPPLTAPETPSNSNPGITKKNKLKMQNVIESHRLVVSVLELKDFWEQEQLPILEVCVGNTTKRVGVEKAESTAEFDEVDASELLVLKAYYSPSGEPVASHQLPISQLQPPPDTPSEEYDNQEWVRLTRNNVTIGRVYVRIQCSKLEVFRLEKYLCGLKKTSSFRT